MDFEVRHIDGSTVKLISNEHKCAITSATQTRKLCGNDTVTINLQSATYIDFQVGDKITIFGTTYTLNQLPTVKKESERSYTYTLVFEGLQYTLIDRVFLMPANTQGDNLMFDLAGMLDVLDDNINRGNSGKQYEFVLDESLEETEYKNLSLTGKNCLQVLQQLCQEWNTEFVFAEEPTRIAIYIGVAGSTFAFPFKYGRGGGVYELNREKGASDICTRLFVYGGTQNLTYYRHNRLCLPLKEKNQSYVEDATAQAVYGIKEQVKNFDDIYPNRIGTITSLSGCDYNEFIDSAMADEEFGFDLNEKWANTEADCVEWLALKGLEDTAANRAIYQNDVAGTATKYLMAGATAKIHFNTGALAGYECDLHAYTHSNQKFVLKPLVDENGYDFPSKTNAAFKLAVGDEYVILDINLPTVYKTQAESKLATEAASYFETVCRPQPKYTLTIEPIALKHIVGPSTADTEIFKVGDLINVSDPTGGVESATIRIDQFVRNLLDPFDYKLTLTDEITYSQQVRTLIEVDAIKRVVEESKIYDVNRIRRGWKDAEELYNQMFDTEGHYYSEKIAPLSIDTQMLKVGARSQQLVLQNVLFQPNYNGNPANLEISAGSLVHYTIAEPDIKTWTMSAYSGSNVPTTAQYVYAKCAKNGTTGTWLVTDESIVFDSELYPNDYHFLVGSLSSVDSVSNTRNFAATYGYTTINGRYITTGVIRSSDGQRVIINLDDGTITGDIRFQSGSQGLAELNTIIGDNTTVQGAVTTANRAEGKIDGLQIGGRNLLLGSNKEVSGNGIWYLDYAQTIEADSTLTVSFDIDAENVVWSTSGTYHRAGIEIAIPRPSGGYQYYGLWWAGSGTYKSRLKATSAIVNTFTPPHNPSFGIYIQNLGSGTIKLKNFKLEKGNKATDWTPAPEDTEAELVALQSDLQTQIDSKIQTWSQSADPSTNWTAAEKSAHTGDLWQYTGTTISTRTQNATYRWSGSAWVEQQASQDLFDKIDGKSTIWYGSPITSRTGVEEDDYLVDGTTGTTYKYAPNITPNTNGWVTMQDYQMAIANIEIGGRNLASREQTSFYNTSGSSETNYVYSLYGGNGGAIKFPSSLFEVGKAYILRFYLKKISGTLTGIGGHSIGFTTNKFQVDSTISANNFAMGQQIGDGTDKHLVTVWLTYNGNASDNNLYIQPNRSWYTSSNTNLFQITELKLEKGNMPTAWSPAPEDVDAEIDEQTRKNLHATCSTAAGTADKVVTCEDWKDSFFKDDGNTRITIDFDNANSSENPYLYIGTTKCFIEYSNALSGKISSSSTGYSPKWAAGQRITFVYVGEKTWTYAQSSETRKTFKIEDEGAFKATLILQKSIEGTTDIQGGMVLTNTIMLRNALRQFTAGISGLTDDGQIAFWAGGTLADAINGIANAIIRHNGSAKFGVLNFSENGEISMPIDGKSRLNILGGSLPSTDISAWTSGDNLWRNSGATTGTGTGSTQIGDPYATGEGKAAHSGMVVTVDGAGYIGLKVSSGTVTIGEFMLFVKAGVNELQVFKLTGITLTSTVQYYSLAGVAASLSYQYSATTSGITLLCKYSGVGSAVTVSFASNTSGSTSGYYGVRAYWLSDITTPKTNIANNGLLVLLKSTDLFQVKESNGALTTTIKGNTDIPGVLWAGRIESGGGKSTYYKNSAKFATDLSVSKSSNSYTITHNLGTTNYAVQITPYSNVTFTITKATNGNSFTVALSLAANFDLTIFGTN